MKIISFEPQAWEDYLYWQNNDKVMFKKINSLIKEIQREPFSGVGKPESLKNDLSGFWSRRINQEHRLVYTLIDDNLVIAQCRLHY
ncbi:MAG: Txe/YoeB family addiction module toxin [Rickettsiales bacterium]|jgi:toxin YoeB|nr:Txe/YoeB family addiction module toxin [Rickettsiales bacterium]